MKPLPCCITVFAASVISVFSSGCTESPFNDAGIVPESMQIRGEVELSDGSSPEGVYLWLEGVNIATYTDRRGHFEITLAPSSQGTSRYANGAYNLYFYLANYELASARVAVQNGAFLYSWGDITSEGGLDGTKLMHKLLHISTFVRPTSVGADFEGPVHIVLTLQAVFDSVTVVFPKMVGGLLGGILLQRMETGEVFVDIPDIGARTRSIQKVGAEPRNWVMVFNLTRGALPVGRYEVIPYFLIEQESMPPGLIASLGPSVQEIGPDFLKIPIKRDGGLFVISE